MRLTLICVGRLHATAEGTLAREYAARATASGRSVGLGPVEVVELRGAGPAREGEAILSRLGSAELIALDVGGQALGSQAFAALLAARRSSGCDKLAFAVGGADGLDPGVLARASRRLSLGPMTWPHALARVMLAEQIYRAATILAGGPYHRA